MSEAFECELMSWDHFDKLAKRVSEKIKASEYQPEFIVGLARGGWVLSRVLCDYLGVKDLVSLKIEHWGVTATPDGKARIKYPFDLDLSEKNVLIVDDITDTGESMMVAAEYVQSKNPSNIKTAALRHIEGSKFVPDFYGDVIQWRWVVFPWNYLEDMCNILPKIINDSQTIEETKRELKNKHSIDLSQSQIEEIINELKRRNK